MSVVDSIGVFVVGLLTMLLMVAVYAVSTISFFALIGFTIYFFLAAGGILPPLDFIPFVPYI